MSRYMDSQEFQAIMDYENYTTTDAVKVYLNFAAYYKRLYMALKKNYQDREMDTDFLNEQLKRLDEQRMESVWQAIDTAKMEKDQGWRFLEDGEEYISMLLIKYQGDLSKLTRLEKLKVEFTENVDEQKRKQIKANWRML